MCVCVCVGWWDSPGMGRCAFEGLWSLLWKYLYGSNEADKAPGARPKLASLPLNIDCPKLHPQMKGIVFSLLTTNLATLKKPEGDLEGPFWSYRPMAKTFLEAEDDGPRWWSGQGASGRVVSLVFLYLCHSVFDWLHSHRFLYLPVKPLRVFFLGGGGRQSSLPHSLPLPAHSAFSRWHPLPTHLHCVPIMHTDSKSFVWADTHTRAHSNKLTQTCVILRFTDFWDSYCLW